VPARQLLKDASGIIAPADGTVVVIEEVEESEFFNDKRVQISIFMSPANVHLNRNPISGQVVLSKYHPGKYLVAWHPKSSTENERHTVVLEGAHGSILVRQIAGAMARRIVNYSREGTQVQQNQEMGFIKFGSRVDVFVPLDAAVAVRMNQKVKGGQTLLASFAPSNRG
jgi:phosphatidylserine decarboxylase